MYLAEVDTKVKITGYSDASLASLDNMTSVSGYVFLVAGGAITWTAIHCQALRLNI